MMRLVLLSLFFAYASVDVEANFATFFCYGDKNDDSILNQNDLNSGTQNLGWLSEFKELLRDQNDSSPSNKIPLEILSILALVLILLIFEILFELGISLLLLDED